MFRNILNLLVYILGECMHIVGHVNLRHSVYMMYPLYLYSTLNEEVAYKRGLGRPEMKFIYAKSKHCGTSLVHITTALGVHAWRRAPTNLALGMPAERGCKRHMNKAQTPDTLFLCKVHVLEEWRRVTFKKARAVDVWRTFRLSRRQGGFERRLQSVREYLM